MLWDIDHTLVSLPGIGKSWYASAMGALGWDLNIHPDYSGRTERAISTDVLTSHGIEPTEANIQRLWKELIKLSDADRSTFSQIGHALEGALSTLAAAAELGAVQTLVTGNLPEISLHKLTAFGLDQHLELEIGGYGSLSLHRHDLVLHAIPATEAKHRCRFTPDRVVVIGDTPNDVRAALNSGVVAAAVATGRYSAQELTDAGADIVFTDLSEPDVVSKSLLARQHDTARLNDTCPQAAPCPEIVPLPTPRSRLSIVTQGDPQPGIRQP